MKKSGLVVLLVAAFALSGALYATAAPQTNGPSNAKLAAQVASLQTQVKTLKADVSYLTGYAKALDNCQLRPLWFAYQWLYISVQSGQGDVYLKEPPTKRPDCL